MGRIWMGEGEGAPPGLGPPLEGDAPPGRLEGTALVSSRGTARPFTPLLLEPADFSAALMISSSSRLRAAQSTIHSTMSSLPSPSVCQTAFSSAVFPVMLTRVPPPPPLPTLAFFCTFPNSIRFGGIK